MKINDKTKKLKVAIVHYWLDSYRGGERVIESVCELFPNADIYTHIYKPENLPETITKHNVFATFISKLPFARKFYRHYLLLMPFALLALNLKKYDLIISSESGPAKGVRKRKDALHICYCHSPMRYIWDMKQDYTQTKGAVFKLLWEVVACYMRFWDRRSVKSVDQFIANSKFISARIKKFYNRKATVINPPVDVDKFNANQDRDDFYLCASQLVPYKKVDLVVKAFNELGLPLVVIGTGTEFDKIKAIAKPNIKLLGKVSDNILKDKFEKCKAFVYGGKEDFGIVLVEALAAGAPVIAYGRGGAAEIVEENKSGLFFREQTSESIIEAVKKFELEKEKLLIPLEISEHAKKFAKKYFKQKIANFIEEKLNNK